ncbi:MAG: 2OG-Fe dioxygenase family protein [Acidihalobacter sp.]
MTQAWIAFGGNVGDSREILARAVAMLCDDAAVRHGVTPIHVLDPAYDGVRDMLVITARRADDDLLLQAGTNHGR